MGAKWPFFCRFPRGRGGLTPSAVLRVMDTVRVDESEAAASQALAGDADAALVIAMGRAYHQAGVASDQLEDLMETTAHAVRLELQVTALPTSITAAIGPGDSQKVVLLRLQPGIIDLRRLALLNGVFERVVHHEISTGHAALEIERIDALRHVAKPAFALIAYVALSFGASILLGGYEHEQIVSAIVGFAVGVVSIVAQRSTVIARLFEVLAAFAATAIVSTYATFVHPLSVYVPIVAGVVQLLPGLQLTLALHELAYRNLVAGTARLGGVLMSLLSLGCGFALGVAVVGPSQLHVNQMFATAIPPYQIALGVVGIALAIAILENARPVDIPLVFGSCAVAEIAYRAFAMLPGHQVATFGAALVVGIVTSLVARIVKVPQAVLLVPGLLILVPGSLSYESILFVVASNNNADAASIAINSIFAAVEIVAGLLLAQLFIAPAHRH